MYMYIGLVTCACESHSHAVYAIVDNRDIHVGHTCTVYTMRKVMYILIDMTPLQISVALV